MSTPLSTLIHGDLTLETGCDTGLYGFGDLNVASNVTILGTAGNALNLSAGGAYVAGNVTVGSELHVNGVSYLKSTFIDTSAGVFNVSGGNAANIVVGTTSSFITTQGDLTLASTVGNVFLSSGLNSANAVQILATNNGGGVNVLSGQNSLIALTAGSGGIQGMTSTGSINLTANNPGSPSSFVVNSAGANQNLTLGVAGSTDSTVIIQGSGTNVTVPAIQILTTNTSGNIVIANTGGSSAGSITNIAGSGGFFATTNTGGPIGLTANGAASYFVVNTNGASQNLTIGVNNTSASALILTSAGTGNAIQMETTSSSGNILITQAVGGTGGINVTTGSTGLSVNTQIGGGINLLANGASSSFINQTINDNQDLTMCVQGNTASKLILCSTGTSSGAITISSTSTSGSINTIGGGAININTSGGGGSSINIGTGTNLAVPIYIGQNGQTTTINGNLDVLGTTTTTNVNIVSVTDNVLILNATTVADSGFAVKRYQGIADGVSCAANNGAIVSDPYEETNVFSANQPNNLTLALTTSVSRANGYYNGWWIRWINTITGLCHIRRIKSWTNTSATTGTATIYDTADQVISVDTPASGADLLPATADSGDTFFLYPCSYMANIWNESANTFQMVCTPTTNPIDPFSYANLSINNLSAVNITTTTINGVAADTVITIVMTDGTTSPVPLTTLADYGLYILLVKPAGTNANDSQYPYAIFLVGKNGGSSCGQVVRVLGIKGVNGANLDCQWPAGANKPQIFYRPFPLTSPTNGTVNYTVKVITV
jgi:hypothetical protein